MSCGWPPEMLEFSLGLHHHSKSAYTYMLREKFALPSLTVLQRRRALCMKQTGPCSLLLKLLGDLVVTWESNDKLAVLLLDGMNIRKTLKFMAPSDRFGGFEDMGSLGRSSKVASEAVVGMLRGVARRWKNVSSR